MCIRDRLRKCLGELPVLFTFRSSREGGEAALSDGAYQSLNEAAIASGFVDCVDVELFSGDAVVKAVVAAAHRDVYKRQTSGYAGFKDWFIQEYNRPGYTIEVGMGVSPLPMSQFAGIYEDNRLILEGGMTELVR